MRKPFKVSDASLIAGVFVAGVVLVTATISFFNAATTQWIRRDAEADALLWATVLSSEIEDVADIAAGETPSLETHRLLEALKNSAHVYRFKIFDREGRLKLISDELGVIGSEGPTLSTHNEIAREVVATKRPFTTLEESDSPNNPAIYAESYLPLIDNGEIVAIIEVYVNQTETVSAFNEDLRGLIIKIAALAFLTFAVPYSAFLYRSRGKKKAEKRADFFSHHDTLTGALNRATFVERVELELDRARTTKTQTALHYMDIDRFKKINDAIGTDNGDELIRRVYHRISDIITADDFIGRLGGDEFVVAQCGLQTPAQAEQFSRRLMRRLSEPYLIDQSDLCISISLGSAIAPRDCDDARTLLKKADLALFFVKNTGRNNASFFRASMDQELHRRRALTQRLQHATRTGGFVLHFQPIMHVPEGRVSGFEALIRLPEENGELVEPANFLPIAEDLGLLPAIGDWVIATACEAATSWPSEISIAINLSPSQFNSGKLPETVARTLKKTGLRPERLELEITENILLHNTDEVMQQLTDLRKLGVSIVMDDFGTGYSSLAYLWRFPFSKIKIDRSFMQAYSQSAETINKVLEAIIALGKALDIQVTIEGVETLFQAQALENMAFDHLQGYLFGKPMAEIELPGNLLRDFLQTVETLTEAARDASDQADGSVSNVFADAGNTRNS